MRGRAIEQPKPGTPAKVRTKRVRNKITGAKETIEVPENAGDFIEPVKKPLGISFYGRYIPEKPDHGKVYFNLSYQLTKDLRVGADVRPITGDVSILANWRAISETDTRPALILGTSHDDFGTTSSQSYYGTLSKYLFSHEDVHFSGYAGATYIEQLNDLRPVGGAVISYDQWSTTFMYSGVDPHWVLSRRFDNQTVSFVLFAMEKPGLAYGVSF